MPVSGLCLARRARGRPFASAGCLVLVLALTCDMGNAQESPKPCGRVFRCAPAKADSPRVALTFDDGPDGVYTSQILDLLAENHARATFFVVGRRASTHRHLLSRMVAEGHELGNHTWNHAHLPRQSSDRVWQELAATTKVIRDASGRSPRWLRPPYGEMDARVRRIAREAGYDIAMWSVDPQDWRRPGGATIFERVSQRARDGAVILLHDGGGVREGTLAAVRQLVPALNKRGFRCVTLSELVFDRPWGPAPPVLLVRLRGDGPAVGEGDSGLALVAGARITMNGIAVRVPAAPVGKTDTVVLPPRDVLDSLGVRVTVPPTDGALALRARSPVRVEVRDERSPAHNASAGTGTLGAPYDRAALGVGTYARMHEVFGVLTKRELEEPPVSDEGE
jgi:peptidoglycan/xylan/chitin deacetylase (PgdA/CDA1 family)